MFNSEIKEKYLDTLSEGMVMQMRPIFAKAEITETLYIKTFMISHQCKF